MATAFKTGTELVSILGDHCDSVVPFPSNTSSSLVFADDRSITVDSTAGDVTKLLPDPLVQPGAVFEMKRLNAAGNLVRYQAAVGDSIDGLEFFVLTNAQESVKIVSDNTSTWRVIATSGIVTPPGGSNTQLQYNNNGVLDGISGVSSDGTNLLVSTKIVGAGAGGSLDLTGLDSATVAGGDAFVTGGNAGTVGVGGSVILKSGDAIGSGEDSGEITIDAGTTIDGNIGDILLARAEGQVGIGVSFVVASALLELDSTTHGFLMPHMTTTERDAIPSPATGLEIVNTTNNQPEFYNGTFWTGVTNASVTNQIENLVRAGQIGHIDQAKLTGTLQVDPTPGPPLSINVAWDGRKVFIGDNGSQIRGYDLSTPWDITTASIQVDSFLVGFSVGSLNFSPDGLTVITHQNGGDIVRQINMTIPWDLSTASTFASVVPTGPTSGLITDTSISPNGHNFYIHEGTTGVIFQYFMSEPFQVSTMNLTPVSSHTLAFTHNSAAMDFSNDGRILYVQFGAVLREFALGLPWDITSTGTDNTSINTGDTNSRGMVVKPDGTRFYHIDFASPESEFHQFDIGLVSAGIKLTNNALVETAQFDTWKLQFNNPIDGNTGFIEYHDGNVMRLNADGNALILEGGSVDLVTTTSFTLIQRESPDTDPVMQIDNTGSNAGRFQIFTGSRDPSGNVTGNQGDLYIRNDGLDAALYQHQTSAVNTEWTKFLVEGSSVESITAGTNLNNSGTPADPILNLDDAVSVLTSIAVSAGGNNFLRLTHDATEGFITNGSGDLTIDNFGLTNSVIVRIGTLDNATSFRVRDSSDGDLFIVDGAGRIGIGTGNPDLSAQVEILTTARGFLQPRLTDAEKIGISNPATGLSIFDTSVIAPETFNGSVWQTTSRLGVNEFEIHSAAELDAHASGGVITVSVPTTFRILEPIVTSTRFSITGDTVLTVTGNENSGSQIVYIGTATLFSGSGTLNLLAIDIIGNASATLLSLIDSPGSISEFVNANVIGFGDLGTIDNNFALLFRNVGVINNTLGFTIINTSLDILASAVFNMGSDSLFDISGNADNVIISTSQIAGLNNSGSLFRIDPGILENSRISITGSAIDIPFLFDITGGATGTFINVSDASVSLTTIDSVTDSSGIARFNFTVGPTLFVNQEIDITNFVTQTNYNQTGIITATGAGFFEIASIAFTADDATGDLSSNSVTLLDVGTSLVDGDSLIINTTAGTQYDGGATVYNQLASSFQINRTFSISRAGTWDTSGIDASDPRILANNNPGFARSKYISAAFVNDNSTANGTIVNNTFTDMTFGTGVGGLDAAQEIERFKLINGIDGLFEYIGNEPFDGYITFDFTVTSSGGIVDFRFKWVKDIGAGFVDLDDNVEALVAVGADAQSITKTFPLSLVKGDQIKPQITRNSGASGITTSYATIYATQ